LIACRTAVPDIEKLVDFLVDEFRRLKDAAGRPQEPKVKKIEIKEARTTRRSA
jgi:diacylglycerol O-acyltransferase / wax synthase